MAENGQDAEISAGDTVSLSFPIFDSTGETPADLSAPQGYWALGRYKQPFQNDTPLISKSSPSSGVRMQQETVSGVTIWVLYADLNSADTLNLTSGEHYFEARIVDGGAVSTIARGVLTIDATIIR